MGKFVRQTRIVLIVKALMFAIVVKDRDSCTFHRRSTVAHGPLDIVIVAQTPRYRNPLKVLFPVAKRLVKMSTNVGHRKWSRTVFDTNCDNFWHSPSGIMCNFNWPKSIIKKTDHCAHHANCTNIPGGHLCECFPGFRPNKTAVQPDTCDDINECAEFAPCHKRKRGY